MGWHVRCSRHRRAGFASFAAAAASIGEAHLGDPRVPLSPFAAANVRATSAPDASRSTIGVFSNRARAAPNPSGFQARA